MRKLLLAAFVFITAVSSAQIGGKSVYPFLEMPNSARTTALGGYLIAIYDNDVNVAYNNPAMLNPKMHNMASISYVDWFSDVNIGFASYARTYKGIGNFYGAFQYINYGKFDLADEAGNINGTFTGGDYCINLGYSRQMYDSLFSVGANLKTIFSNMGGYSSSAMAVDLAAAYNDNKHKFTITLVARNVGAQLKSYNGMPEPLPINLQLGLSKGFKHLPLRLYLNLHDLQRFDFSYVDTVRNPTTDPLTGEPVDVKVKTINKIMRHVAFGAELSPFKFLTLRLAYNFQRRAEMAVDTRKGTVGISWGLGLKISKFRIDYGRAAYHLAGSPNHISISTNISDWVKK